MGNFNKEFQAKRSSCFKREGVIKMSPLGKVEGGDDEDPVGDENPNETTDTVKYKWGKAKGKVKFEFKEERDEDGNVIGHDHKAYNRKGEIKPKMTGSGGTLETEADKKKREEKEKKKNKAKKDG